MGEYSTWMYIVHSYTRGRLTYETDRLAAIQGLANEFKKSREDEYIMGLWTGDLPQALLWHRDDQYLERTQALATFPSWSWASVTGHVFDPPVLDDGSMPLGAYVGIADGGRRLIVKGLGITGQTAELPDDQVTTTADYIFPYLANPTDATIFGQDGEHLGWAVYDEKFHHHGDTVHCPCLFRGRGGNARQDHFYGLLLKKLDNHTAYDSTSSSPVVSIYKRLGIFAFQIGAWVNKMEEELVWIV
ncbi:hypothetical protein H2201_002693 [Coniosporium apollinis]|uniref:Uncharacterized protein n=1 Tax=Coniosporium apollinis TaxID=61459 RepID=A0ABQ9NZK7_9PEZI|nr:hypothetical protein H2201_002693 [Coniosporium apollinis]